MLYFIKVITGSYIIGEGEKTEEGYVLQKPLSVIFEPMMGGLQVIPYDAYYLGKEIDSINVKEDHVMHEFTGDDIPKEIADKYTEFKSGIVQAPANAIPQNEADIAAALGIQQ